MGNGIKTKFHPLGNVVRNTATDAFVALSFYDRNAYTSVDGTSWTVQRLVVPNNLWYDLTFTGTKLVGCSGNGEIVTSTDAKTWVTKGITTQRLRNIAYGNGIIVAVNEGTTGAFYSTDDGVTWTGSTIWTEWGNFPKALVYTVPEIGFILSPTTGRYKYYTSTDGANWTGHQLSSLPRPYGFAVDYFTGTLASVCPGRVYYTISDPTSPWTAHQLESSDRSWHVTTSDGQGNMVILANNACAKVSLATGAVSITSLPIDTTWKKVIYANGKYVAVPQQGLTTLYSTDGLTWSTSTAVPGISSLYWVGPAYYIKN